MEPGRHSQSSGSPGRACEEMSPWSLEDSQARAIRRRFESSYEIRSGAAFRNGSLINGLPGDS